MKKLFKENIQEDMEKRGNYEKFIHDQISLNLEIDTGIIFKKINFKNNLIEEKFQDQEKERYKMLKIYSDIVLVSGYLITIIYIIFAYYRMEILFLCLICKLISLFVMALSYIKTLNNKYCLAKLEHLNIFSLSMSFACKCFIICLVYYTAEDDNQAEILRIIIYYSIAMNLMVFLKFEANIFIYLFYFGINIIMIIISTWKSNKNRFYFLEGLTSFLLSLIFFAFRKVYDYLLRKTFAQIYKYENYYNYTIDFIKGLNSLHVHYQNDCIKYIDPKFENLLITLDNLQNENKNDFIKLNEFNNDQNYFYGKIKIPKSNNINNINNKLILEDENENKSKNDQNNPTTSVVIKSNQLLNNSLNNNSLEVDKLLNLKNNIDLKESGEKEIMYLSRFTEKLILFNDEFSTNTNTDKIILEEGLKFLFKGNEKYYFNSNEDNNITLHSILNAIDNKIDINYEKTTDNCDKNFNRFKKLGVFNFKNKKVKKYFEVYYRTVDFKMKGNDCPNNFINNNNIYDYNPIINNAQHDLLFYDVSELILSKQIINENHIGKEKILAKIAHEFKTPITSIIGLVGSIKENLQSSILLSKKDKRTLNLLSESNSNYSLIDQQKFRRDSTFNNISINNNLYYSGSLKSNSKQIKRKTSKNIKLLHIIENLSKYVVYLISDIIQYANMDNISQINIINTEILLIEIAEFVFEILKCLLKCSNSKDESIETELIIDESLKEIIFKSDETRLKQILLNIISNAVKFTKYGKIQLIFKLNLETNEMKIIISDTGMGIKDEDKLKLFNDFVMLEPGSYQNPQGSGLGLSICKSLAYKLNIKLDFHSEYGKGSKFFVYIPLDMSVRVIKAIDELTTKDNLCSKISDIGYKKKNKNLNLSQTQIKRSISSKYCKTFSKSLLKKSKSEIENEEKQENKHIQSHREKSEKLPSFKNPRRMTSAWEPHIERSLVFIYFKKLLYL